MSVTKAGWCPVSSTNACILKNMVIPVYNLATKTSNLTTFWPSYIIWHKAGDIPSPICILWVHYIFMQKLSKLVTVWCEIATWPTWQRQNLAVLGSTIKFSFPGGSGAWKFQCFWLIRSGKSMEQPYKASKVTYFRSRIALYNKPTYRRIGLLGACA